MMNIASLLPLGRHKLERLKEAGIMAWAESTARASDRKDKKDTRGQHQAETAARRDLHRLMRLEVLGRLS